MKYLSMFAISIALIILLSAFSTRFTDVRASGPCNVTTTFDDNPSLAGSIEAGPTGSTGGSISGDNTYANGQSATYSCQTVDYCIGGVCTFVHTMLNVTSLPLTGYTFVNWTIIGTAVINSITANPATITLTANKTSTVTVIATYIKNPRLFHSVYFTSNSPQAAIRTGNVLINASSPGSIPSQTSILLYRSSDKTLSFYNASANGHWIYALHYNTTNQGLSISVRTVLQTVDNRGDFNATTIAHVQGSGYIPIGDVFTSNSSMTLSQYYGNLSSAVAVLGTSYVSSSNQTLVTLGNEWLVMSQSLNSLSAAVASRLNAYNVMIIKDIAVVEDCWFCELVMGFVTDEFCILFIVFFIIGFIICEVIFFLVWYWSCTYGCTWCFCS